MKWSLNLFGPAPIEQRAQNDAESRAMERARDELNNRVQLAVVDHNGKRLNERRWRWLAGMVESL